MNIKNKYYKAYENRYKQIYKLNELWTTNKPTPTILKIIKKYNISKNSSILEIGCGEGRDTIYLLENGYNVLGIDYSKTVIKKCISNNKKYINNFKQIDIIKNKLNKKYDFIYSIAVIHMFITKEHRNKFYNFIYNHLNENGIALILSMGDGIKEYTSNINETFDLDKRYILNSNKEVNVAKTSCKIVNWNNFEKEIKENNLKIIDKCIITDTPEFDKMMCVVLKKDKSI